MAINPNQPGLDYYILVNGEVVSADLIKWAEFFEDIENRRIGRNEHNQTLVSTVFIGMHDQMFETMVFVDGDEKDCVRTDTLDKAREIHREACLQWGVDPDAPGENKGVKEAAKYYHEIIEAKEELK